MDLDYQYSTLWVPQYIRKALGCYKSQGWRNLRCARVMDDCWSVMNTYTGECFIVFGETNQVAAQHKLKMFVRDYQNISDKRIRGVALENRKRYLKRGH